jgi:peptidoglycan/LPS O-acetylase OafA/YrhL
MAIAAIPLSGRIKYSEYIAIALVIACPAMAAVLDSSVYPFLKWFVMVLVSGTIIILLTSSELGLVPGKSFLKIRFMVIGGEISYGIYLLHDGIQRYARVGFEKIFDMTLKSAPILHKTAFLVSTSALAVLLAYMSWSRVELPARKFIRKRFQTNA